MTPNRKLALMSFGIVAILTATFHFVLSAALFYTLWPGIVVGLVITGGHGSTTFQEGAAVALGLLVNAGAYFCLLLLGRSVLLRRKSSRT